VGAVTRGLKGGELRLAKREQETGPKMMMKKYLLYDKLKVLIYKGR
jgi:hypothetical protein